MKGRNAILHKKKGKREQKRRIHTKLDRPDPTQSQAPKGKVQKQNQDANPAPKRGARNQDRNREKPKREN
jgi:hypothetical protein